MVQDWQMGFFTTVSVNRRLAMPREVWDGHHGPVWPLPEALHFCVGAQAARQIRTTTTEEGSMSNEGCEILERVLFHLRADKRIALEINDAAAFHADEEAIQTIQDTLKVVKSEQEQARREHTAEVRRLAHINPAYKKLHRNAKVSPSRFYDNKAA
jgi:hypothetical protein